MKDRSLIKSVTIKSGNVRLAGRIVSVRKMKNFSFCDITDVSGKIQLLLEPGSGIETPSVGDIVRVNGKTITAKSGQLSIECKDIEVLSKSNTSVAGIISGKTTGNLDIRGQRSLDLMVNQKLNNMVYARSIFINTIRDHFREGGFLEVDTPVFSYSRFAGTAEVFEVKSRTLDRSLYMRGTLEDYLKQLIVAGFEKVFQIGDCFRNESPALIQFTMLEATWAYATSDQMLDFIQALISRVCETLPNELVDSVAKEALSQPLETVSFWHVLDQYFGVDIRQSDQKMIKKLAAQENYSFPKNSTDHDYELAKFGYDVIKRKLAHEFTVPTFVERFPASISPLARNYNDGSNEADRGYGFFRGQRLFEVVEEASSYQEQLQKFQNQDDRSNRTSHSFKHDDLLTALSYGCPPMAGLGFNINRILAVLLNVTSSADVVAFPLTKAALPL